MFANKVVVITGAGAGIGAATAECFAKEGATLAVVDKADTVKDIAQRCEQLGAQVLAIKADISIVEEAKTIVTKTVEKFGKLDVLVNNAGIMRVATVLDDNILEVFDEVMNTNLRPNVIITNSAVPYLIQSKGNIINVSSTASKKVAFPGMGPYAISKAGIDHFTRSSAMELAPHGVRVNSVNPGPVLTDMARTNLNLPEDVDANTANFTPFGRVSEAEEIGDLILYLAGDKARGVTGSTYVADNGLLLM